MTEPTLRKLSPADKRGKKLTSTMVITPVARLAYPWLLEPKKPKQDDKSKKPRYSACLIFDTDVDLQVLIDVATDLIIKNYNKNNAVIKKYLSKIFHDGDSRVDEETGIVKPEFKGKIYINSGSETKPKVGIKTSGITTELNDYESIYPGMYVRACLNAFSYRVDGNQGVSYGLCHIQKLYDGPRLDGRISFDKAFEDMPDSEVDNDFDEDDIPPENLLD